MCSASLPLGLHLRFAPSVAATIAACYTCVGTAPRLPRGANARVETRFARAFGHESLFTPPPPPIPLLKAGGPAVTVARLGAFPR